MQNRQKRTRYYRIERLLFQSYKNLLIPYVLLSQIHDRNELEKDEKSTRYARGSDKRAADGPVAYDDYYFYPVSFLISSYLAISTVAFHVNTYTANFTDIQPSAIINPTMASVISENYKYVVYVKVLYCRLRGDDERVKVILSFICNLLVEISINYHSHQ